MRITFVVLASVLFFAACLETIAPSDYMEKPDSGLNGTMPDSAGNPAGGSNVQNDEPGFQSPGGVRPEAGGHIGVSPGHQAPTPGGSLHTVGGSSTESNPDQTMDTAGAMSTGGMGESGGLSMEGGNPGAAGMAILGGWMGPRPNPAVMMVYTMVVRPM